MENEGSSPYSQLPATCPYPKPARSIPLLAYFCHYYLLSLLHSSLDGSPNGTILTEQAFLIQRSAKNLLTDFTACIKY